jgi:AraC-like DNA-binding protein
VVEVETAVAHHLPPPQQAVWIPAGLVHRTTLKRLRSVSVFFAPEMVPAVDGRARILAAEPVDPGDVPLRVRWPIGRGTSDETADAFFEALARIAFEWLDHETPLSLPTSQDVDIAAVMAYTQDHLEQIGVREVVATVGFESVRAFSRAFGKYRGETPSAYRNRVTS